MTKDMTTLVENRERIQSGIAKMARLKAARKMEGSRVVKIYIKSGCVTGVKGLPNNYVYEIIDSDNE